MKRRCFISFAYRNVCKSVYERERERETMPLNNRTFQFENVAASSYSYRSFPGGAGRIGFHTHSHSQQFDSVPNICALALANGGAVRARFDWHAEQIGINEMATIVSHAKFQSNRFRESLLLSTSFAWTSMIKQRHVISHLKCNHSHAHFALLLRVLPKLQHMTETLNFTRVFHFTHTHTREHMHHLNSLINYPKKRGTS